MSDSSIVSLIQSTQSSHYIYVAAVTLVLYDHLLTMDREMHYMWSRGFSRASVLFFMLRYGAIAVAGIVTIFKLGLFITRSNAVRPCRGIVWSEIAADSVVLLAAAAFSALRVYVLCASNSWLAGIVLIIGIAHPAVAIYVFASILQTSVYDTEVYRGCRYHFTSLPELRNALIAARVCAVLSDVIVLFATWARTWPTREGKDFATTVSAVLFEDGTIYFVGLAVSNLVSIFLISNSEVPISVMNIIGAITVVFTCRFILDLHEANAKAGGWASTVSGVPNVATRQLRFQHDDVELASQGWDARRLALDGALDGPSAERSWARPRQGSAAEVYGARVDWDTGVPPPSPSEEEGPGEGPADSA